MDHGFVRVCAASPALRVADVAYNAARSLEAIRAADEAGARILLLPELGLSGYSCADLFQQERLLEAVRSALGDLARATRGMGLCAVVGLPLRHKGLLYDCAAVLAGGEVKGLVPKSLIPNYKEFYEARWFAPGRSGVRESVELDGKTVPLGAGLLFRARSEGGRPFLFGIEICEDLWAPLPPSSLMALRGASLILNPSASNELVGKADYRRALVLQQSARCVAAYLYASAGPGESSTDLLFSGHCLAAENGLLLAESRRFQRQGEAIYAEFDVQGLEGERARLTSFRDQALLFAGGGYGGQEACCGQPVAEREPIDIDLGPWRAECFDRPVDPHPFVPSRPELLDGRCREIFSIQAHALAKRLEHSGAKKAILGVSGGLDSALALLVCAEAMDILGRPRSDILALTMPGFGTSAGTLEQAQDLMRAVGAESRSIDIREACLLHFRDIGHDPALHDLTYENVQARERTQILMDLANASGGLVIGTGDLSEAALGWSTYNGDHMSMYAVNAGVPKTLVRHLVAWASGRPEMAAAAQSLGRILDTPVSPELLPLGPDGEIAQRTEDIIGPYELHDFFLYHHLRWGCQPGKIAFLAGRAFAGVYRDDEIAKWLGLFYRRFFSQQFKRSCVPDGPKLGSVSLSPRGDWRMPSDASPAAWLDRGV